VVSWPGKEAVDGEGDGRGGEAPAEEENVEGELVVAPLLDPVGGEVEGDVGAAIPCSAGSGWLLRVACFELQGAHGVGREEAEKEGRRNGGGKLELGFLRGRLCSF
jgi:hypothetical protein